MSNLICPVCRGTLKEVDKGGVVIDTCTQCRGVWLDRGELEKLSNLVEAPQRSSFLGGAMPMEPQRRWKRDDDDDDDDRRYRQGAPQKRRSLLDFFD